MSRNDYYYVRGEEWEGVTLGWLEESRKDGGMLKIILNEFCRGVAEYRWCLFAKCTF